MATFARVGAPTIASRIVVAELSEGVNLLARRHVRRGEDESTKNNQENGDLLSLGLQSALERPLGFRRGSCWNCRVLSLGRWALHHCIARQ